MPIELVYRVRCGECREYLPPLGYSSEMTFYARNAAVYGSEHDATAHAKLRGWSTYPLLCQRCSRDFRERLCDEGRPSEPDRPSSA